MIISMAKYDIFCPGYKNQDQKRKENKIQKEEEEKQEIAFYLKPDSPNQYLSTLFF